ncbi:MAG: bifunctional shikimate kinase/3-dehydroquinate synthase [Gaiellaceae bacterium]
MKPAIARPTNALHRHIALAGFMGAGKTTLGSDLALALGRNFVDVDSEIEREAGTPISEIFAARGESEFRLLEERRIREALEACEPAVIALGGGALGAEATREALRERALTILVEVDVNKAWHRVSGAGNRPLAGDEASFRKLFAERLPVYRDCADATCSDLDGAILAAGGVEVAAGALARLGELVPGEGNIALISDENVAGIYGAAAKEALADRLVSTHVLPAGEDAKTFASFQRLLEELPLERGDLIVALGGGCVTDVGGFAAATYMRGIAWVSVPTSLVGQVDAGTGGKTAINIESGKNLVGAFHWPARTVIDPDLLVTLPEQERREGMAELVKHGVLLGERIWELPDAEMVRRSAVYKLKVVLRDPHEHGIRATLNLGHTFAHALETAGAFGSPTHGEAVALGLVGALRVSIDRYGLDPAWLEAVEEILFPRPVAVDRDLAWTALFRDKKVAGGRPKFVLMEAPGKPIRGVELDEDEARRALDSLIADS